MTRGRLLTLLLATALVVGGCATLGLAGDDGLEIDVEFSRAFNLFEGSNVRIAGVNVGRVENVVVEPGGDRVIATLRIDEGTRVADDAGATIIQSALLGERYVQLHPPYTGGDEMADGARIPIDRTTVPVEFEEAFESLNDLLETLDRDEVARLVTNLAEVLEGQGDDLGETIDELRDLMAALRTSDEDIVELAGTLADLNETVGTRAEEMTQQFEDLGLVAESLASDRADLERTLVALTRMTDELGDLVATHRDTLRHDIGALTSLGRTVNRNLDEWQRFQFGQAELFRHAERVIPLDRNWLPVINHTTSGFEQRLAHRIQQRLVGVCLRLGIEACAETEFWDDLLFGDLPDDEDGGFCLEPVVPCPDEDADDAGVVSFEEALERGMEAVPELEEGLREDGTLDDEHDGDGDPQLGDVLSGSLWRLR